MLIKKPFTEVITDALKGREILMYSSIFSKSLDPNNVVYSLSDIEFKKDDRFSDIKEVSGKVVKFTGEEVPYEGDFMQLEVKVNGELVILSVNSVEETIVLKENI